MSPDVNRQAISTAIAHRWDHEVIETLHDFVAVPNVSPAFDAAWAEHGHMD